MIKWSTSDIGCNDVPSSVKDWYSVIFKNIGRYDGSRGRVYSTRRVCKHAKKPKNQLVQKIAQRGVLEIREETGASSQLRIVDKSRLPGT